VPLGPPRWYWLAIVAASLAVVVVALGLRMRGRTIGTD